MENNTLPVPGSAGNGQARQPNYLPKLIALFDQGKAPPGTVTEAAIAHDDWCSIFRGGVCDCEPDVQLLPRSEDGGN